MKQNKNEERKKKYYNICQGLGNYQSHALNTFTRFYLFHISYSFMHSHIPAL